MDYILTVTLNTSVDTTLTLPFPLLVGETNRAIGVLKLPGGKGINVARVLQTLRVPVHVTGLAGGSTGEFIKNGLEEAGIDSTFLPIAGTSRTCTALVEHDSSRVTEINEQGPIITETEAEAFLDLYETLLPSAQAVVLSGSLPQGLRDDYYALLLNRAHAAGVPCILDTSDRALQRGIEARPLLVKPNVTEAGHMLGKEVRSVEDAVGAGQSMRQRGAQMAAITLGADGAVLVTEMGAWLARLGVSHPISGVGSGDAFIAGIVAGPQDSVKAGKCTSIGETARVAERVVQAFTLAVACGAANTLCLGAGVLKCEDVERFRCAVEVMRLG